MSKYEQLSKRSVRLPDREETCAFCGRNPATHYPIISGAVIYFGGCKPCIDSGRASVFSVDPGHWVPIKVVVLRD